MKRMILLAALFLAAAGCWQAANAQTDSAGDYARWIKPWTARATNSPQLGGAELKLIVTTIVGEQPLAVVTNMTPLERLNLAFHLRTAGTEVSTNGRCWSYFASNTDSQPTPVRALSAADLTQLDALLARLPDDHQVLPPPGRRVIVQTLAAGRWQIRVYDGRHAPPEVVSLLKLLANPFAKSL